MKEQNEREINKLREIKNRTATIRKRYEEQQTAGDVSYFTPETYGQAKRAGDYYMFNYDPITQSLDASDDGVPEVDPGCTDSGITPAQLAYLAVDKNFQLDKTLKAVKSSDNILNEDDRINKAIQRDQDESESLKKSEESCGLSGIRFILKLLETGLAYVAAFLNRQTREHRYVSYVLNQEKITLRNKLGVSLYDCRKSISDIRKEWDMKKLYCVRNESDIIKMENLALTKWNDRNVIGRFLTAAGFCVSAYTDILCYILAIVAHAKCGLITMPLPLMVFCWGTLASPRPSKLFWICMIAYTQAVIILKFVVQFGEMGNEDSASATSFDDDSTFAQFLQFAGLVKMNGYAIWDVFLLFALFFHRYYLRSLGLWKAANVNVTFLKSSFNEEENVECEIKNTELPTVEVIETVELPPEDRTSIQSSNHQITVEKNNKESVTSSEPFIKNALRTFFENLFHPKFRSIKDLYPFMFLMDVIAFFIVVFGYKYFGDGSTGNVISDISSNRVPLAFVLMMIVMSMMLVVDRGLYLRKAKYCKFAYHIVNIIFLHIWLFIFLPKITTYQARANKAGMFLYIVKGIYLLISAWQIRNGYPVLCSGNLITHRYGLINMVCFKIFQAVPFLYEMRTAIDWTWTDTSMPLFDYFNMENYYAVVYNLKCARTFENKYPAPRGVAKATIVKYLMGVPMILILIFVIWCPLLAFALLNTIGLQLPPESVKMSIGIEGFPPIYTIESQGIDISNLTPKEYNAFISNIRNIDSIGKPYVKSRTKAALSFSEDYTFEDVHRILFRPESENMWRISSQKLKNTKSISKDVGDAIHFVRIEKEVTGTSEIKVGVEGSKVKGYFPLRNIPGF
uniref:Piezo_RRas_bdg domain-containing protein n=1 Tax=Rhabditophanes sp. KR3021 TaxID=114890 RepID=A0AC35U715_9BILA